MRVALYILLFTANACFGQLPKIPIHIGGAVPNYAHWTAAGKSANVKLIADSLTWQGANGSTGLCRTNRGEASGKYFWEFNITALGNTAAYHFGLADATYTLGLTNTVLVNDTGSIGYRNSTWCVGYWFNTLTFTMLGTGTCGVSVWSTGIYSFALDLDAKEFRIYKQGTLAATVTGLLTGTWYPICASDGNNAYIGVANFGRSAFTYTPAGLGVPSAASYNLGFY